MIWILGVIAALAAGVALIHLLLRPEPPRRRSRPPLAWRKDARFRTDQRTYAHAAAPPAASYDASPLDDFAYLTYDAPAAASHSVDDSPSFYDTGSATSFDSCDTGSNASFDSCDTGSSGSFDSGDCGSGGGSFD